MFKVELFEELIVCKKWLMLKWMVIYTLQYLEPFSCMQMKSVG